MKKNVVPTRGPIADRMSQPHERRAKRSVTASQSARVPKFQGLRPDLREIPPPSQMVLAMVLDSSTQRHRPSRAGASAKSYKHPH
jgi:hypothetical protein